MSFRTIVREDTALRRDPLRVEANGAVARGWHVFPCVPNGKRPATANGYKDAQPTVRWWPKGCNVGLACGASGLLVVDLDVKHDLDGVTAFYEWAKEWPLTYEVATPSGGVHLYFSDPDGHFDNSSGCLPKGIDIRGRGGYVLGAGSVINGQKYRVVNDIEPILIPDYLAKGLSARRPRKHQGARHRRTKWERMLSFQVPDALNRITNRVAEATEGERNNVLFWAACRWGEAIAAGWVTEEQAEDELLDAAHLCGLVDEDGESHVLATIESGISQE